MYIHMSVVSKSMSNLLAFAVAPEFIFYRIPLSSSFFYRAAQGFYVFYTSNYYYKVNITAAAYV